MSQRQPAPLETVSVVVPEDALEVFEAALSSVCSTVGFFRDEASGEWRVEGVRQALGGDAELAAALALARGLTGLDPPLERASTPAEGWLARTLAGFPEQLIGRRFAVRGTHVTAAPPPGRIVLTLDAGLAFGSGEHGSTRGCLLALEGVIRRRPRRILDLGTGSGILAIAAARALHRPVLATDIEPWAVRVARENAADNGAGRMVRVMLADGWHDARVRRAGPFDLVFANILARPLCAMAKDLGLHLSAGGTAVLSGLLKSQARAVLAAHRRRGMVLERAIQAGAWTTLVLRLAASVLLCLALSSCTEAFQGGSTQPALVEADTPFGAVPLNSPAAAGPAGGGLAAPPGNLAGGLQAPASRTGRDGLYKGVAQVLDSGGGLCPETQEVSGFRVSGNKASYGGYTGAIGPDGSVTMYYGPSTIMGQFNGGTFRGQLDVPGRFGSLGCSYMLNLQQTSS